MLGSGFPLFATAVSEGDQVDLRITSDRPFEFHMHGYDLKIEVEENQPTELSFDASMR